MHWGLEGGEAGSDVSSGGHVLQICLFDLRIRVTRLIALIVVKHVENDNVR